MVTGPLHYDTNWNKFHCHFPVGAIWRNCANVCGDQKWNGGVVVTETLSLMLSLFCIAKPLPVKSVF